MAMMKVVAEEKGVRMPDEIGRRKSGSDREPHLQLLSSTMQKSILLSYHPLSSQETIDTHTLNLTFPLS